MSRKMLDVRIELVLKNNRILERMEEAGINTNAQLCRLMGWPKGQQELGRLINMKQPARQKTGEWCEGATRLADFFHCDPDDLFSTEQQWDEVVWTNLEARLSYEEARRMAASYLPSPDESIDRERLRKCMGSVLATLTPREERVLRMRFGFNRDEESYDLDATAAPFQVTRERIRQIEAKALRKLKHPSRSRKLKAFLDYQ